MLRIACIALAMAALGGCVSLGSAHMGASPLATVIDSSPAPIDATLASSALARRGFSPPSQDQPDQRQVLATVTDRAWRSKHHARRRRQRNEPR
jgi:hypothetical protein